MKPVFKIIFDLQTAKTIVGSLELPSRKDEKLVDSVVASLDRSMRWFGRAFEITTIADPHQDPVPAGKFDLVRDMEKVSELLKDSVDAIDGLIDTPDFRVKIGVTEAYVSTVDAQMVFEQVERSVKAEMESLMDLI